MMWCALKSEMAGCAALPVSNSPNTAASLTNSRCSSERHLVTFGHDVVRREAALGGNGERTIELGQVTRFDNPRLIGQHVETGFERLQNAVDLAAISPGEHDDVTGTVPHEFLHGIRAEMDVEIPIGGVDGAGVETRRCG